MTRGASYSKAESVPRVRHHLTGWCSLLVVLCVTPVLAGCPGTLSPEVAAEANGAGGAATGTGGSGAIGGTGGTSDCSAQGAQIVMNICATAGCHDSSGAPYSGGLDLTLDSGIASRLVGVTSVGTTGNYSDCADQTEFYLDPHQSPAAGLLIDKTKVDHVCGSRMPLIGQYLTDAQTNCLIEWATTLTSP